jgi:nickel-dependent lactate racemase
MEIAFAFGKGELPLTLPQGPRYQILRAHGAEPVTNLDNALGAALDQPIGCAPLCDLASGKRSAAIAVCDITRPAPNSITLPPLIERLHRAGIERHNVTILIATGLHRIATAEELRTILGPEIAARYRIVNHDARDLSAHRPLGKTARGTPVHIDEQFMAADLHISLGFIEQHLMLGFSGGRKLIAPGLAAQETIKVIHSPKFMREAEAREGSLQKNPLHRELLEIAGMARHDFILDVTLTRSREISGIFAGEPIAAHAAGVQFLNSSSRDDLDQPVDAAITSAAGYPLDLTFYQTIKGITAAQHIVREGGSIFVLAECAEGAGSPEFAEKLRAYRGPDDYLDGIRDTPVEVDQWQIEKLALVAKKHPLLFFTPGVSRGALGALGEHCYGSPQEAMHALLRGLPSNARVAVIPDGPYTYAALGG